MATSALINRTRSMPGLAALALMVVFLAGCSAPQDAKKQSAAARNYTMNPYLARATDEDPIGRLLSQQVRRPSADLGITPRDAMVGEALSHLGIRYRYGGNSPDQGFDCSGLVSYVAFQSLGLALPRSAAEIAARGQEVPRNDLVAGDLVFFNTMGRKFSHVGIYLGDDRFVHSPSSGGVVRVEDMTMAYWSKRYNGARRLDSPAMTAMGAR